MKTYQAVRAEIAKLEKQAEELRRQELKTIIAQVRQVIADYGLSAADVGLAGGRTRAVARKAPARASRSSGVAKYRDPKSGQTWTGHGRPPAWIAGAKDRDAFLIDAPAAQPASKKVRVAKAAKPARPAKTPKVAAKKRAAKPATRGRKGRAAKTPAVEIESGVAVQ
ncbi:H-NS histone family protein [Variovorax sp. YR752]|uniref:H-NS histone family protein n=1 Tax=Variovorax sp. YR752 TaxID=1884383 RepID=UPI003137CD63